MAASIEETSMILEQELQSGVGKFGLALVSIFLWVGNTSFQSTVQLLAACLASVEVTLT